MFGVFFFFFSPLSGVVALNDCLYCIGGSAGQRCIAECEMYDPSNNIWKPIAPLNAGKLVLHMNLQMRWLAEKFSD